MLKLTPYEREIADKLFFGDGFIVSKKDLDNYGIEIPAILAKSKEFKLFQKGGQLFICPKQKKNFNLNITDKASRVGMMLLML